MLELLDLDQQIPKETYEHAYPDLEIRLGTCQRAARAAGVPVVIVFEGWDAAGKGKVINRLVQALDPRDEIAQFLDQRGLEKLDPRGGHAWLPLEVHIGADGFCRGGDLH